MPTESLTCNSCGAGLQIPEGARYVRCNHCGGQLAIRRDASVAYTELIEQVAVQTEKLTDQVAMLTYQNEINRIDQDWARERDSLMIRDKHGNKHQPSQFTAIIGAVIAGVMGLVVMTQGGGAFGLVFILFGGLAMAHGLWKLDAYKAAEQRYQRRRRDVCIDEIHSRVRDTQRPGDRSNSTSDFPGLPS
ncbi:MAG: hypothetical protein R3B90_18505 [Planctomycetaceae bacterium]